MEFEIVSKYLILWFIMDNKNNHQINENFFLTESGGESRSSLLFVRDVHEGWLKFSTRSPMVDLEVVGEVLKTGEEKN